MPKTIIVPLDGTPLAALALAPAHALARQSGAEVVLVMSRLGGIPESESYLRGAALTEGMESARTVVFEDRLADSAITTLADSEPDAVVCMMTHARHGLGEALFGGTTERVIRETNAPLLLVGPSVTEVGPWIFEELIVCLDGSRAASEILPIAAVLARDLDLALWLVSVVDPATPGPNGAESADDALESAPLQHLADELRETGLIVNWDTLHGDDPAAAIVDFVATRYSPMLAMTTHGRTGLAGLIAGSVTMSVVHRAPCPVLVTRTRNVMSS